MIMLRTLAPSVMPSTAMAENSSEYRSFPFLCPLSTHQNPEVWNGGCKKTYQTLRSLLYWAAITPNHMEESSTSRSRSLLWEVLPLELCKVKPHIVTPEISVGDLATLEGGVAGGGRGGREQDLLLCFCPVSYTHLTLPTKA